MVERYPAHSADRLFFVWVLIQGVCYLALFIQHGDSCEVVSWVESWFGYGGVHVGPGVHDVVGVTVIDEVFVLQNQPQSPVHRKSHTFFNDISLYRKCT